MSRQQLKAQFKTKQDLVKYVNAKLVTEQKLSYYMEDFHTTVNVSKGDGKYNYEQIIGNNFENFSQKIGFFKLIDLLWNDVSYICKQIEKERRFNYSSSYALNSF